MIDDLLRVPDEVPAMTTPPTYVLDGIESGSRFRDLTCVIPGVKAFLIAASSWSTMGRARPMSATFGSTFQTFISIVAQPARDPGLEGEGMRAYGNSIPFGGQLLARHGHLLSLMAR